MPARNNASRLSNSRLSRMSLDQSSVNKSHSKKNKKQKKTQSLEDADPDVCEVTVKGHVAGKWPVIADETISYILGLVNYQSNTLLSAASSHSYKEVQWTLDHLRKRLQIQFARLRGPNGRRRNRLDLSGNVAKTKKCLEEALQDSIDQLEELDEESERLDRLAGDLEAEKKKLQSGEGSRTSRKQEAKKRHTSERQARPSSAASQSDEANPLAAFDQDLIRGLQGVIDAMLSEDGFPSP